MSVANLLFSRTRVEEEYLVIMSTKNVFVLWRNKKLKYLLVEKKKSLELLKKCLCFDLFCFTLHVFAILS